MNTIQTKDKTHWLAHGKLSCMAAAAGLGRLMMPKEPVEEGQDAGRDDQRTNKRGRQHRAHR